VAAPSPTRPVLRTTSEHTERPCEILLFNAILLLQHLKKWHLNLAISKRVLLNMSLHLNKHPNTLTLVQHQNVKKKSTIILILTVKILSAHNTYNTYQY